ncbi:uncharacterized protein [Rutidosis leptorrhynchoides]|uniref:uncharacterized protein n=1 Tax=Rutidosis leptorrhynchoides TaxID=125765 RepID=UPI003A99C0B6
MECNKDEALRAKEISEAQLLEKDFMGAKKFAQKAEKLFSGLEGLSQLLIILDVYISSEKKINGELDWYGVLGVGPTSDTETIRRSYRKLALSLHPDKNKSVGAEGAFKLVSEAWTLLSDKTKRKVYDQKRNPRPVYQPVNITQKTKTSNPRPPNVSTFWTSCPKCRMHFEYATMYLNHKILCPSCREPFWATEKPGPPTNNHSTLHPNKQNHKTNHQVNVQQGTSLNTASVNISGQFKSRHEAKVAELIAKRKRVSEQSSAVNVCTDRKRKNSTRELSQAEIRNMLMAKARKEISKKLDEWNADNKASINEGMINEGIKIEGELTKIGKTNITAEEIVVNSSKFTDVNMHLENATNADEVDVKDTESVLMSVPDPDFHDFDMDRTERSFAQNQIWAAYDEDDGMPRYYAMIHNVISVKPFKMQISWLNSKSNAEIGPVNWVASGFPKTSGDYRVGKHEINMSLNSFSHKVHWTKAKKGVIKIYPRKGDVWALYRNWSSKWNELTPDETIHKYDMVVIVDDYDHNEEKGVMVAPLVKVSGFKSLFYQHADVAKVKMIPKEEMFRLSHQVPFYMLTDEEAVNVPKGCLELDPAALPSELLQTTIEPNVISVEVENSKGTKNNGIITYSRKKAKL